MRSPGRPLSRIFTKMVKCPRLNQGRTGDLLSLTEQGILGILNNISFFSNGMKEKYRALKSYAEVLSSEKVGAGRLIN